MARMLRIPGAQGRITRENCTIASDAAKRKLAAFFQRAAGNRKRLQLDKKYLKRQVKREKKEAEKQVVAHASAANK